MTQTDSYGHHEVLHLANVIERMWADFILEHGAVLANPELKAQAEKISEAIGGFYVAVGGVIGERFPTKKRSQVHP